jgi:monothiol glutaredoxin
VLENEDLRAGIKEYSNWPTIPQVFFKGEFIGGYDILLDMHQTGELKKELESIGLNSKVEDNTDK